MIPDTIHSSVTLEQPTVRTSGVTNVTCIKIMNFYSVTQFRRRRGSSVDKVNQLQADYRSSIPGNGKRFLSSPKRPDRRLDLPCFLFNAYQGLIAGVKAGEM